MGLQQISKTWSIDVVYVYLPNHLRHFIDQIGTLLAEIRQGEQRV